MSIVLEAVAGAALSAFFDVLFDKLSSSDLLKIFSQGNVDADLKNWETILREISDVLDDAEEKQITNGSVKTWLDDLEALAYDADDILDEFATEALRRKVNAEEEPSTSKIRKFIPACCVGFNPRFIKFDVSMRSKIEGIDTKLQGIVTRKERLKLLKIVTRKEGQKLQDCAGKRTAMTSLAERHTYGRDEDKKKIVKLLLEPSDAQPSVIPIVGMGGLGKTTLAQLVYQDDKVRDYFNLKAWACVSEDFDNLRLTKEILHSFTSESWDNNSTLDTLQVKLKEKLSGEKLSGEKLSGEKFLLILDDVWNEDYELWTQLRKPFEYGAPGSKIVVTTRNFGVASTMGTTPPYKLEELSHDACLRVFTHHALDATDFSKYRELEEFGQKIVNRCKGVPLAAKVLGGLLRTARNRNEWEHVLNSKILDIPEEKGKIFSILKLSYNYLPSHLKRCFAYCSLFSKYDEFEEKDLVLLWMAEGLVQETKGNKPMEDLGGDYFRDLLNRSFFQQSSSNESLFVMHDLMNDLAMWAAGDLCCRLEDQLGGSKQSEISTKVRHFSYNTYSDDCIIKVDDFPKDMHLRTFLLLPLNCTSCLTNFDANCLLPRLRYLRVLSLGGYEICELPSSIGDLKHLRYLNLSYLEITSLPESTCSLYNLQTLILKDCSNLIKLPEKIENLVNLRHLDITNANSIIEMPVGMAKLKSLQTLSNFVVGKNKIGKNKIVDLMNLESLRGTLCISHLENMLNANDAINVNLKGKKNLDTLVMEWNGDLQHARVATDILNMLQPHVTLKTLSIIGYVGVEFPTWLGDPSFSNMVDVRIERCGKCMFLPAFGQLQFLKHLVIKGLDEVYSVGPEFYGEHCEQPFRSLVKLCFEDMHKWQDWSPYKVGIEEFPCLHELSISKCPKLQEKLPHYLPSLKKLSIKECARLVVSIPNLSVLQELTVKECAKVAHGLMSLVTQEINIESCQSPVNIKLKSTLRKLTINDCSALESLEFVIDEGGASSTSSLLMNEENLSCIGNNNASLLEHSKISNCPSLKCVSTIVDLSPMLKRLDIADCPNLTSLSSKGILPTTLKVLSVHNCPELELIVDELHEDTLLEDLLISNCEKLRRLPRGLHELCHLKKIYLQERDSLISNCPSLKCISFPEEGFHTNLRELVVGGANLCKQIFEFGLHRLTSLRSLFIAEGIMDSFPEEEDGKTMLMLPTSLTHLKFIGFPNLLFLSWKFFPNLSTLEEISIRGCPKLASLSEKCFPPSLQRLYIYDCPVLKQNCEKDKGIMWSKIANIPSVMIDYVEQQE